MTDTRAMKLALAGFLRKLVSGTSWLAGRLVGRWQWQVQRDTQS
jgi:hypothetical protein